MLSKEFSELLQESIRKCRDARERERLRALYALSVGYPIPMVADIFTVDEGTVYRWVDRWHLERSLSDKPKVGRPGALAASDVELLRELVLEAEPEKRGVKAAYWSTKELRDYLAAQGRRVSQETVRRCLRRMGAVYIKPDEVECAEEKPPPADRLPESMRLIDNIRFNPHSLALLFDDDLFSTQAQKRAGWTFGK